MVLRAKAPKRSAISSCAGPKTRRKSLARNLPNLLAAIAVIVFTDPLQDGEMVSLCKETGRRKTPVSTLPTGTQRCTQPDCAADAVCPRRRSGRIATRFAAVHESSVGHFSDMPRRTYDLDQGPVYSPKPCHFPYNCEIFDGACGRN